MHSNTDTCYNTDTFNKAKLFVFFILANQMALFLHMQDLQLKFTCAMNFNPASNSLSLQLHHRKVGVVKEFPRILKIRMIKGTSDRMRQFPSSEPNPKVPLAPNSSFLFKFSWGGGITILYCFSRSYLCVALVGWCLMMPPRKLSPEHICPYNKGKQKCTCSV